MAYCHLTMDERHSIRFLCEQGISARAIARSLGRSASTVVRELRRNGGPGNHYEAPVAQRRARHRRAHAPRRRILDNPVNRLAVLDKLEQAWSPEQIAGHMAAQPDLWGAVRTVSFRTIYRMVERMARAGSLLMRRWPRPPRKRKSSCGKRGRIVGRVGIEHRPADVVTRQQAGHWEVDTIVGRPGEAVLATFVERKTRFVVAFKLPSRHAQPLSRAAVRHLGRKIPACLRSTLTFDNGTEFADFKSMERGLGVSAYFAHPHSPWQRGSNENTNGLIRHFLPKKTNLTHVSRREINRIVGLLNNRPRKCLNWRTPAEAMAEEMRLGCCT